jgi:ubiquinone/menaquinone biosynthesis C-methylase UbiE
VNRIEFVKQNIFGKILDVGCSGRDDELHNSINDKNVYGLDIEIRQPKLRKIKGDAQKMPLKSNNFDTIAAGELIEHLPKPTEFLKETKRILKSRGIIIITTPNKNSLLNKIFKSYYTKSHQYIFDTKTIKSIISKYFIVETFFCLPYTEPYLLGPKGASLIWFRRFIHHFLPQSLQENMIILARKK